MSALKTRKRVNKTGNKRDLVQAKRAKFKRGSGIRPQISLSWIMSCGLVKRRHARQDRELLLNRKKVLEKAKQAHPNRWSKGVRNCGPVGDVTLNPEEQMQQVIEAVA